ncbi:MAG TPA: TIGR02269 family lipoprotein [Myxococcaceae bacterium]
MSERVRGWLWLLVSCALVGCAGVPHAEREEGCEQKGATFEEVCQQEGTLLAVCEGGQCAAYRCWEVAEYLREGQVVRARWARPPQPTAPPNGQTRREVGSAWNGPQGVPQPVLLIPWSPTSQPLLPPGQVKVLESQEPPRGNPYERHHIYPQASDLKEWFEQKGINIHEWTLALEVEEHRRIHRGPNGGPWNEAWRRFMKDNQNATKLEIELHAGKLIYEFNLYGVVVPYRRQLLRLPSNVLDPD